MKKTIIKFFLVLLPVFSKANFVGNDTQNFNPLNDGLDFVTVHGSQTLDPGLANIGLFTNWAKNSLPSTYDPVGQITDSNDEVIFSDIGFGYGLAERWSVGLSLSYLLDQKTNRTQTGAQFAGTGLNEIRFGVKYNLVRRNPWGFALIASTNINEVRSNPFTGRDSAPVLNLETALDYHWSDFLLAFNLGYRSRRGGQSIPNAVYSPLPNQWIASVAASTYFSSIDSKLIAEIFAARATKAVPYVDASQTSAEFLLGLKHDFAENVSLQLGGGTRIAAGLFTPDLRIYAGLSIPFDIAHRQVSVKTVSAESPPEAPVPVIVKNFYKGFQPEEIEKMQSEEFDEIMKTHEFSLKKSVSEGFEGEKPPFEVVRLDDFEFDFGSSVIKPEFFPMLDKLVSYLKTPPDVLKVRVEGHTDSLGSLDRNRSRSGSRAEAVRKYLIGKGVDSRVIESVGFGADRPIADNGNFQGRKQNRRVEVRILRKLNPSVRTNGEESRENQK